MRTRSAQLVCSAYFDAKMMNRSVSSSSELDHVSAYYEHRG